MQKMVELYGARYDQPGKGHDRVFLDTENQFAAVFDGAGGDELSEAAAQTLPIVLANHTPLRHRSPEVNMRHILADIDNLAEGLIRPATGALASVDHQHDEIVLTYANAGDSSIYFFDKASDSFKCIAHTPTAYFRRRGRTFINTSEFLGAARTAEQIAPLVGQLILPVTAEWTLIGVTDGIQDDDGQGILPADLEEAVRLTPASTLADTILGSIIPYDDASLFVMNHQT